MTLGLSSKSLGNLLRKKQQLDKQASGDFGLGDPAKANIAMPDAVSYGAFGQNLAAAQAGLSQDPAFGGGFMGALTNEAEQENRDYDRRLQAANAAALEAQKAAQKYGLFKTVIENTPDAINRNGLFDIDNMTTDPVTGAAANAIYNYDQIATGHKDEAEALKGLRDAGVTVTPDSAASTMGNPVFGTPATGYGAFPNNRTPNETANNTTADARAMDAETNRLEYKAKAGGGMFNAKSFGGKGGGGGSGDGSGGYGAFNPKGTFRVDTPKGPLTFKRYGDYEQYLKNTGQYKEPVVDNMSKPRVQNYWANKGYKIDKLPNGNYKVTSPSGGSAIVDPSGKGEARGNF